jgi:hypothetical protein
MPRQGLQAQVRHFADVCPLTVVGRKSYQAFRQSTIAYRFWPDIADILPGYGVVRSEVPPLKPPAQ